MTKKSQIRTNRSQSIGLTIAFGWACVSCVPNLSFNNPNESNLAQNQTVQPSGGGGSTSPNTGNPGNGSGGSNLQTSVSRGNITWTFSEPKQVGQYINGDWWVLGPVNIVSVTPAHTTQQSIRLNGSMIDPSALSDEHGYCENNPHFSYNQNVNVTANVSASNPLTLSPGQTLTTVKCRMPVVEREVYNEFAVLQVVDIAAPADAFRPPYYGSVQKNNYDHILASEIQMNLLQSVPLVGAGKPTPADIQILLQSADKTYSVFGASPWANHQYSQSGRGHVTNFQPNGNGYQQYISYGRNRTAHMVDLWLLALSSDIGPNEKQALVIDLIQWGLDLKAAYDLGMRFAGDGGHSSGFKLPMLAALKLLNRSSELNDLLNAPANHFGESSQTFWTPTNSNHSLFETTNPSSCNMNFPGPHETWFTMYYTDMTNFNTDHCSRIPLYLGDFTFNSGSYQLCCTGNVWNGELLIVEMLNLTFGHTAWKNYVKWYMQTTRDEIQQNSAVILPWNHAWRTGFHDEMYWTYMPLFDN